MHENEASGRPYMPLKKIIWVVSVLLLALAAATLYPVLKSSRKVDAGLSRFESVKKGVAAGDPVSLHALGRFFEEGINVPRSYAEAIRYYTLASDAGNLAARYDLAKLLASDNAGAQKDVDKAFKHLLDLANRGDESAQFGVAFFYRVKQRDAAGGPDLVEAYAWANVVLAGRGDRPLYEYVHFFYYSQSLRYSFEEIGRFRDLLEAEITKDHVARAQARSAEIFKAIEANRAKK
jgi:TPR repeat protein